MGDWSTIDASQLLPSSVVSGINGLAGLANTVLSAFTSELDKIPSLPSAPDTPSPTAIAAQALLDAVESLTNGSKIHVIVIPISKTIPAESPPAIPATVGDLQDWLDVSFGPAEGTAEAYQRLVASTGGNAGFYRAFSESMFDAADLNRPTYFNQTDAVTMAVLLAGSSSYAGITQAASVLDQLLRPKGSATAAARTVPVPQNVTAAPVAAATGARVAVKIGWDPPQPTISLPYFPGLVMSISRYAVIRMTGPAAPSVRSVLDIFSTQDLTAGLATKTAKVIAVGSGKNSSYLDTEGPEDPTTPVYYCVAWETSVKERNGTSTLKFDRVSAVAKVHAVAPTPSQTGSPPDWTAFGAAVDAFPAVANATTRLLERGKTLVATQPSPASRLEQGLKTAGAMADRLEARAVDLMNDVKSLQAALSRPMPSLHVTRMTSGTGGNAFLLSELARRLGNVEDSSRPAFDHGEYVCGVCFVAGAPRLADLAAAIAFFDAMFGPAAPANPLMSLLAALDTAVTAAETDVFGPNMQPLPAGTPTTSTGTQPPGGTAIDPLTGKPATASTPVISSAGVPVATSDPENPNAGDTNVKPLSELC